MSSARGRLCEVTSPAAMEALGQAFGAKLAQLGLAGTGAAMGPGAAGAPGLVVGLEGDLGAGKTTFVRGLVAGATGTAQRVTSPTFQLLNLYRPVDAPTAANPGGRTVAHIDAYRLIGAQAFAELGLADLLDENVIVVVEWPDRTGHPIFADEAIYLRFTHIAETVRRVELLRAPTSAGELSL